MTTTIFACSIRISTFSLCFTRAYESPMLSINTVKKNVGQVLDVDVAHGHAVYRDERLQVTAAIHIRVPYSKSTESGIMMQ